MKDQNQLTLLASQLKGELFYTNETKDQTMLLAYSTDASVYQEKPLAVAIPADIDDIKKLIDFAQQHRITIIPRTAGTSLAGQVVGHGIIMDISRHFNGIIELNVEEQWVRVQPGVIRDDLNSYLKPFGLMFGPETSTASRAMVGGMIGNNSSGLHSIVWGDTRHNLISANVLLDDCSEVTFEAIDEAAYFKKLLLAGREGDIYRNMNELLTDPQHLSAIEAGYPKRSITRRNTGYALDILADRSAPFNMCNLLAGSEGTLAIVTEAKLKLMSLPPQELGLLCVHFADMVECMHGNVIALEHKPEASELVDKYIMDFTVGHPTYKYNRFFIEGDPQALLIVEFRGQTAAETESKAMALKADLIARGLGYAYPYITGIEQTNLVWDVRKAGLGLIRNLPGDSQPVNLIEDCAVSPEDLPAYVSDIQKLLIEEGVHASYYAHAGAGELHIEPFVNLKTAAGKRTFRSILEKTSDLVLKYNGSLSGEHGDGRLRGEFIGKVLGEKVYKLLEDVKSIFDPQGVFNANKIVNTPPMDSHLRYDNDSNRTAIKTYFDFSKDESILRLAEKCSGSGDCRKTEITGGTMCPSFMATRDEKDTTRARANMLRQFLTNSTKKNRFDHEEIKEVMDLCLSCKGCKTECPSSVDVAKMKAEFLQHYYDEHGAGFRTKLIANFTQSQKLGSWVAPLYNFVVKNDFLSGMVKKTVGFAPKRSLPTVNGTTLTQWVKKQAAVSDAKRRVYLFSDEFTEYNDAEIGITAYKLLTALGYEVVIPKHVQSGRTYLSKGFVKEAKKIANQNIHFLKGLITDDTPLLGVEPSGIITFRDEYLSLVDDDLRVDAQKVAKNALMIDEFLLTEMKAGRIHPEQFTGTTKKIKLHGHCYQKAFHLVTVTEQVLSFPTNFSVETIPSGCCGMAGSFGYEAEHYDVSMKVAELVLLPTIRKTSSDTLIAAAGTSCRHQIKDGVGRKSYHPVEILYDALLK
ncbi:FAD-binding and (Fe-S)-binding domain-containing protein [Sphingobacterium sp. BIGb0116]|uniref:FAD-binding and (Fe-S)-binding domain-containing protein n=1 Tax=Sphingobacterium sp. BIGb0116 TaxID=2940619 RepID=UPI002168738C|nr:FAD-binding and (Fe-S)-binding domain-containing protein [Sphingobacterium sp. BIGb0116]MCS4164715.1 FAD/FMN-containing dehydrogenase/Fe-S oxidoreductase [Sphingobacterium sp. BIGb0116]